MGKKRGGTKHKTFQGIEKGYYQITPVKIIQS